MPRIVLGALQYNCPICAAMPGWPCTNANGRHHQARRDVARRARIDHEARKRSAGAMPLYIDLQRIYKLGWLGWIYLIVISFILGFWIVDFINDLWSGTLF